MSRFWGGGSSESESSESDYSSTDDSGSSDYDGNMGNFYSSDSDSDTQRVVKSHKEKQLDFIDEKGSEIRKSITKNDWLSILSNYDELLKQEKNIKKKVGEYPRSFYKILVSVQDTINEMKPKDLKPLDGRQKRAFNAMKQRVRKINKIHLGAMKEYRANPSNDDESSGIDIDQLSSDSGDDQLSASDSDDDQQAQKKKKIWL